VEALRGEFRPEFLNRVDELVLFEALGREHLARIVEIQLKRLRKLLSDKRLELELSDGAKAFLAERGYDPVYGARPLKRAIQRYLQDPLAMKILGGEFAPGDVIVADFKAGADALTFTFRSPVFRPAGAELH